MFGSDTWLVNFNCFVWFTWPLELLNCSGCLITLNDKAAALSQTSMGFLLFAILLFRHMLNCRCKIILITVWNERSFHLCFTIVILHLYGSFNLPSGISLFFSLSLLFLLFQFFFYFRIFRLNLLVFFIYDWCWFWRLSGGFKGTF